MQQQSIICRKWEVSVITGQYRNMSTQCLCWHDVLNWYIVTALEEKKIIKFDEYNGTMILKVREKKVVRKWNSHVRADKISWKLMFLLEMMVTSSRMAWKVSMLINQGSCELENQEIKLMRKISASNTKAVFKQTIMAMAKDQVLNFQKLPSKDNITHWLLACLPHDELFCYFHYLGYWGALPMRHQHGCRIYRLKTKQIHGYWMPDTWWATPGTCLTQNIIRRAMNGIWGRRVTNRFVPRSTRLDPRTLNR